MTEASKRMETALSKIDDAIALLNSIGLDYLVADLIAVSENLQDEIRDEITLSSEGA